MKTIVVLLVTMLGTASASAQTAASRPGPALVNVDSQAAITREGAALHRFDEPPAVSAHEVRLGDINMQRTPERTLQMQLTLGAVDGPRLTPPPSEIRGQALVTLHVRFVGTLRP